MQRKHTTTKRTATTKKKATKKFVRAALGSGSKETAARALVEAEVEEFRQLITPLYDAIEESVEIMGERLRQGDNPRDAATGFLVAVNNRFDNIPAMKGLAHEQYGYDDTLVEIRERLNRVTRPNLPEGHQRLDRIITDLVFEARDLTHSQSIFCEQCEHCLRARPTKRDYEMTTEESVDDKTWACVVERFSDLAGSNGSEAIVVALRHIGSMAWVSRPGAVHDRCRELITAMAVASLNTSGKEFREQFESEQLASIKNSMKWDEEHAND